MFNRWIPGADRRLHHRRRQVAREDDHGILLHCEERVAEYLERAEYFIKSGSQSPSTMKRRVLKMEALEQKKRRYENILRPELTGLDDEYGALKFLGQELSVRAQGI